MKTALSTFLFGIAIYAVITIPTIIIPIMYGISIFYAATFGWAAFLVFAACLYLLKKLNSFSNFIKCSIIYISVGIGVCVGLQLIETFKCQKNVWEINAFSLFPLAAIVAGCISVYINRKAIYIYINNKVEIESINKTI
jgi:hypothetical protein